MHIHCRDVFVNVQNAYQRIVRIIGRLRNEKYLARLIVFQTRVANLSMLFLPPVLIFEHVCRSYVLSAAPHVSVWDP